MNPTPEVPTVPGPKAAAPTLIVVPPAPVPTVLPIPEVAVKGPDVVPPVVCDTAIEHPDLDPDHIAPDAPATPKHIILHRADANPPHQKQSVWVHPEELSGHTTAQKPGDTVRHAIATGMIPAGYTLVNPKTGEKMDMDDDLYAVVKHQQQVEVVKA